MPATKSQLFGTNNIEVDIFTLVLKDEEAVLTKLGIALVRVCLQQATDKLTSAEPERTDPYH